MSTLLWVAAAVVGVIVMMAACRYAILHAVAVAERLHVPPFLVGITLVAVGTDLPELLNSIVSSYLGHGDINIGDSTGSVFTQGSIIGLFPFVARAVIPIERREVVLVPTLTILGLAIGLLLMLDGTVGRLDATILVVTWAALTAVAWRYGTVSLDGAKPEGPRAGIMRHIVLALVALTAVGGAAAAVVLAIAAVSAAVGVPEYILSFFGASLGTSMPEVAVELTALRRGHRSLAIGDALGSCLVDASLSIAAGPLLFPILVTTGLAVRGATIAAVTMLLVAALLGVRGKLDRIAGSVLIGSYFVAYVFLIGQV
jgi:cation:H+ antiporter